MNTRYLVCHTCMDKPFEHHRPIVVPPDPMPILNPRPDTYLSMNNDPSALKDMNGELILDSNGNPILSTSPELVNTPPYPFSGFTVLRTNGGGVINQIQVRDEAYAIQNPTGVQETAPPGQTLQFSQNPATNPNYKYNNLNNTAKNNPGETNNQYAFPVIVQFED